MVHPADSTRVFLSPAEYVDSDHPEVVARARSLCHGAMSAPDRARRMFNYTRDLRYGAPDFDRLASFKASVMLDEGVGYCVPKACAFVALCRASEIPARLAFADVTNHLASPEILELMEGNLFAWHGYAEVLLEGHWLKASPTFDAPLCARLNVPVLEFDGIHDAHLQAFNGEDETFMRYERWHGSFHDVPAKFLAQEMPRLYPKAYAAIRNQKAPRL